MKAYELLLFCLLIATKEARVFQKCELYAHLQQMGLNGFHGFRIDHWICLALHSSNFDTHHYEFDGRAPRYGIFQINGLIWCTNGRHYSQNKCKIDCDMFLDDDITDDVICAKKVIEENSSEMLSWPRYAEFCIGSMPEVTAWECE